jgi:phosphoglycolate phosphatase
MNIKHIIFDLDGTLIDSAPSILYTLSKVLYSHGLTAETPLDSSIIGPPLREIFTQLTGRDDAALLESLVDMFKSKYDADGYKATTIYPGVPELLRELKHKNTPIYIATNKRLKPTRLILEHLGWSGTFKGVYTLDCVEPAHLNKKMMLAEALRDIDDSPQYIAYVGDKQDDGHAADANFLPFFKASWGYGARDVGRIEQGSFFLQQPQDLLAAL